MTDSEPAKRFERGEATHFNWRPSLRRQVRQTEKGNDRPGSSFPHRRGDCVSSMRPIQSSSNRPTPPRNQFRGYTESRLLKQNPTQGVEASASPGSRIPSRTQSRTNPFVPSPAGELDKRMERIGPIRRKGFLLKVRREGNLGAGAGVEASASDEWIEFGHRRRIP